MTDTTAGGWRVRLEVATAKRDVARSKLINAEHDLRELINAEHDLREAEQAWQEWRDRPENVRAAWAPLLARLSGDIGTDFTLEHTGGGCMAVTAQLGIVRVMLTDYADGDVSHPEAGTGWWLGFYLPDSAWSGHADLMLGDPDARGYDGLAKLVAFAISAWERGKRNDDHGEPERVDYGVW